MSLGFGVDSIDGVCSYSTFQNHIRGGFMFSSQNSAAPFGPSAIVDANASIGMSARPRAHGSLSLVAAAVIGLLLANLSVFATFLLFNFILHWGS
jgi:hypothetical protein